MIDSPFHDAPDSSAFDVKLSEMANKKPTTVAKKKAIFKRAQQNLSKSKLFENTRVVVDAYLNILMRKDMRKRLKKFEVLSNYEKVAFAQDIVDEMFKLLIDPIGKEFPGLLVESSDETWWMAFMPRKSNEKSSIWINFASEEMRESCVFFTSLLHEFIHAKDWYVPYLGALGTQIAHISFRNPVSPTDDSYAYYSNPVEINAGLPRGWIYQAIRKIKDGETQIDARHMTMDFMVGERWLRD